MTDEYQQQVEAFLEKTGATFSVKYLRHGKHFDDDTEERDVYEFTLTKGGRNYTGTFGQSIQASGEAILYPGRKRMKLKDAYREAGIGNRGDVEKNKHFEVPNAYDVLACLTKSDPGTFENFCADFGYDVDSRKAERIYNEVVKEYQGLCMLFNEAEMTQMQEIA